MLGRVQTSGCAAKSRVHISSSRGSLRGSVILLGLKL